MLPKLMIIFQMIINFFLKKLAVVGQENVNRAASISKEGLSFLINVFM